MPTGSDVSLRIFGRARWSGRNKVVISARNKVAINAIIDFIFTEAMVGWGRGGWRGWVSRKCVS